MSDDGLAQRMTDDGLAQRVTDDGLAQIADGNVEAFAKWMTKAEPQLRRYLRRYAASVDVEAVLQETLLRVWQVAPRIQEDGKGESLLRIAMRIARNLAIDEARRLRTHVIASEDVVGEEAPLTPDPYLRDRIRKCKEALPNKPKVALNSRLEAAGTRRDAEVAKNVGMSTNTFFANLSRARRLLRACLERAGVPLSEVLG